MFRLEQIAVAEMCTWVCDKLDIYADEENIMDVPSEDGRLHTFKFMDDTLHSLVIVIFNFLNEDEPVMVDDRNAPLLAQEKAVLYQLAHRCLTRTR